MTENANKKEKGKIMEQEVVEPKNYLAIFDPITAKMAEYKEENEKLVFDYRAPQGNKDARSHVFKLRKVKTKINEAHKIGKADALAACREIDAYKNKLVKEIEEMIAVHNDPLLLIEKEREEAEAEALRKIEEEQAKAEAERLAELERREAAVKEAEEKAAAEKAAKEAEEKAKQDEVERIEREKHIAEEAKVKAEKAEKQRRAAAEEKAARDLMEAEQRRLSDIEAVKAKAKAEAEAKELAERRRIEAEDAERERQAAILKKRVENKKHQLAIQIQIRSHLCKLIDEKQAAIVLQALKDGTIPHVKIEY